MRAGSDLDFALSGWVAGPDERPIELHEWNNLEQQYLVSASSSSSSSSAGWTCLLSAIQAHVPIRSCFDI
jgi:hypothetical protein